MSNTPTPWYASADGNGGEHIQSAAINEDNYVARVDAMDEQGHANVDLIIKAVNSHDALLKWATWAYQELMEAWDSHDLPDEFTATLEKIHGRKKCLTNTE